MAAWSRRDYDAALALMDPEIEWHMVFPLPDLPPERRVVRGRDAVRKVWETLDEAWESITLEIEEVLYDEDEQLVLRVKFRGRGRGSGAEVERTTFYAMSLRDGLLTKTQPFESAGQAMAAVG